MKKQPDDLFSRRDFWKVTGVGSLVGSHVLLGNASQKWEGGIVEDYGGPTPPVDEVVLFPFDDFSTPLRRSHLTVELLDQQFNALPG